MNKILPIILLMFLAKLAYSQGSVSGSIKDSETSEALIGATVLLEGTRIGSIADLEGNFILKNVPSGDHVLQFSYVGYADFLLEVTVVDNQDVEVGIANMVSNDIGLKEIQVFASVIEGRQSPLAISVINAEQIQERYEGAEIADIIQSSPGIYSTEGAGGYGDNEVYIRGFDQTNVAFLVNGVPVNDMENGRMYWSNFAGLSEVTRQIQVQRGLGASKLAISSIGGTVNMITKPASRKKGGKFEYQTGTGSWNQRLRFSYNTGLTDNGWAVSFQGSRTTTNGMLIGKSALDQGSVVPGAFTDAWAYYLSISKEINDQHSLMFWAFGAPVNRGTAWVADEATRKEFDITDPMFNNALGIYRGDVYNARQNKINKPLMALSHFWDIDNTTGLSTSVYASFAKVYSTQPKDGESSLFFPERFKSTPIRPVPEITSDNLINWDYLAERNVDIGRFRSIQFPNGDINTPLYEGYESQYYLESRYNNHKWLGLISTFRKSLNNLNLTGGVDIRHYKGSHYAEIFELFGGDFVLNQSRYGDDYNKLNPVAVVKEGDRFNYDYDGYVNWGAVFAQAEYSYKKLRAFATVSGTMTSYKRVGNFWNGRPIYNENSLGESETRNFTTYTLKGGVSYSPTNRHQFYLNGGNYTRPPFFRNSFVDARYSNLYYEGLSVETINSFEVGYGYQSSKFKVDANYYLTYWSDRTTDYRITSSNEDLEDGDLTGGDEIPILLNGLISKHQGVEVEFKYNIIPTLEINGYAAYGDWKWDNNTTVETTLTTDQGEEKTVVTEVNLKGFPVGASAQTTAGIGLHYSGIKNSYIGGRWNYYDRISVRYSPEDVANGFITSESIQAPFDDYSTLQLYAGTYFDMGSNVRGRLSASVQNVLDTKFVRWSSYFFNEYQNAYGYPRTFTIGLSIEF